MRIIQLTLSLTCATVLASGLHAQNDLDSIIDDGLPSWTAGGHYTAELDLQSNTLTLLPLSGEDLIVSGAAVSSPPRLNAGVYVLESKEQGLSLISTNPEGGLESETESRLLVAGISSEVDALGLTPEALDALTNGNVGAIYIH